MLGPEREGDCNVLQPLSMPRAISEPSFPRGDRGGVMEQTPLGSPFVGEFVPDRVEPSLGSTFVVGGAHVALHPQKLKARPYMTTCLANKNCIRS